MRSVAEAGLANYTAQDTPRPAGSSSAPRPSGLELNECPLLPAVERALLGAGDVVDCGALPRLAPTSLLKRAQLCVLDAQRAQKSFRVSYQPLSYDSLESAALASRGGSERAIYLQRTSTPVAPWQMAAWLRGYRCDELRVSEACDFQQGDLCLDCLGASRLPESCKKMETF